MPISKELKPLYPKNWKAISKDIRENRAGNKCEWCGVENHAIGVRRPDGSFYSPEGMIQEAMAVDGDKFIKIVLTTAHLDHNPANNDYSNLASLCQKCHNNYDLPHRLESRRKNRENKNQLKLF